MWMVLLQMDVMDLGFARGVSAVLAHIYLIPAFLVSILERHAVDLPAVGFQGTALSESFATHVTFIWSDTCKVTKILIH
jgi:hypothetical protein